MPLYDFCCVKCNNEFEELLKNSDNNPQCSKCGGNTEKIVSTFLGIVPGSEHRPLDCVVGADAEKKWQAYNKRKIDRQKKEQANVSSSKN